MPKEKESVDEPTLAAVLARLTDIAAANQDVQKAQLKQTAPKSNSAVPKISAFNPRGEKDFPMPALKCEFYAPWKMTAELHSLDREEVELVNLLQPGQYALELNDGATIPVNVVGVKNQITGQLEKMSLHGAKDDQGRYSGLFTNENKQQFPPLRVMLRQFIGEDADAVLPIVKERQLVAKGELAVSVGA